MVVDLSGTVASGRATPLLEEPVPRYTLVVLGFVIAVPFLALLAAVPVAWGWGLSWRDLAIGLVAYLVSGLGVTVGLHRYFTHGSFKAVRWLRIALAVAGSLAVEGEVIQWVADHRRHHAYADRDGDPHSPWRYGASVTGLLRGLLFAHCGWLFARQWSNRVRFAPDLLADRDIVRVDRLFVPLVAANFWPLAIISFGESWHNSHHADPTCARHGVLPGQLDSSARLIWLLEKLRWVYDVRWPRPQRFAALRLP